MTVEYALTPFPAPPPNTAVGLAWGSLGYVLSLGKEKIIIRDNQIAFVGHPWAGTAETLGNAVSYVDQETYDRAKAEETAHTRQGEVVGPLYLPLHLIDGTASVLSNPFVDNPHDAWHGLANFMETGPMSTPPRLWPWATTQP